MSASSTENPNAWRGVRTLVTGAYGFIASRLVSRLTTLGADVHPVSRRPHLDEGPTWHVDLTDPRACLELTGSVVPDAVFDLASATGARNLDLVVR